MKKLVNESYKVVNPETGKMAEIASVVGDWFRIDMNGETKIYDTWFFKCQKESSGIR